MNWLKELADVVLKPKADALIANLKAERDRNIADLEADAQKGETTASAAVGAFIQSKIKAPNVIVAEAENVALPLLEQGLAAALGAAEQNIPALYDAGLAFLEKEDAYL